jgi:hypothetical protein
MAVMSRSVVTDRAGSGHAADLWDRASIIAAIAVAEWAREDELRVLQLRQWAGGVRPGDRGAYRAVLVSDPRWETSARAARPQRRFCALR